MIFLRGSIYLAYIGEKRYPFSSPPPLAHSLQGYWLANFGVACLERTSVSVDFLPAKIHLFRHHNINADLLFTIRKHSHLLIKDNERWISTFCLTQS